jgi:predicted nuclease of predicted toxin-antitoxin system
VKLRNFPLPTDENVDSDVVVHLRQEGFNVQDVVESGLEGSDDVDLLRLATAQGRVIVMHDADFGTLAIHQNAPLVGLIYLRPGHIDARFTIETLQTVLNTYPNVTPPFRAGGEPASFRS